MSMHTQAGMLSDNGIRHYFGKGINIYTEGKDGLAFNLDEQLHVGSVDLRFRHLYNRFSLGAGTTLSYELLKEHAYTTPYELSSQDKLQIGPGEIIFTTTLEIVSLSEEFAAMITGRSSIARLGVMVHCCQEFIHPGHGQAIPLQIVNLSPYTVELDLHVPICQIVFFKLATPASERYIDRRDAKYSQETDPVSSRIYEDISSETQKTAELNKSGWWHRIRKNVDFVLSPILPGIFSTLIVTPLLAEYIINKSLGEVQADVMQKIANTPAPVVVGIICYAIYLFVKGGNKK